jgi:hypothetical protein
MSWTIKTLKKYFDLRFKDDNKARKIAKKLMNSRLKGMNNIHSQLVKQNKTFISFEKFDGEIKSINQKIEDLSRLVYIGLGVWIVLQIIISVVLLLIFKK